MNIAVAAEGASLEGMICGSMAEANVLLIIAIDDSPESAHIIKCISDCSDADMARAAAAENCEAVISGVLETEAFNILADGQITRFDGSGMTVYVGIKRMQERSLGCFTRLDNENDDKHVCGHEEGDQ